MTKKVIKQITAERKRQIKKFGSQSGVSTYKWLTILMEEVGEAAEAALDIEHGKISDQMSYRNEIIQVAAVAVQILEHLNKTNEVHRRLGFDIRKCTIDGETKRGYRFKVKESEAHEDYKAYSGKILEKIPGDPWSEGFCVSEENYIIFYLIKDVLNNSYSVHTPNIPKRNLPGMKIGTVKPKKRGYLHAEKLARELIKTTDIKDGGDK